MKAEDLDGLLAIASKGGSQSKVRFSMCGAVFYKIILKGGGGYVGELFGH